SESVVTNATAAPDPSGDLPLVIRGLHKSFQSRVALDGVDLTVKRGELVVLLGANGSGKSTALRCVVGLLKPDAGSILVSGQEIVGLSGAQLVSARRRVAMIFQQINLVRRRSALDNVCCGALGRLSTRRSFTAAVFPYEVRVHGMSCLHRVGLSDRAAERA